MSISLPLSPPAHSATDQSRETEHGKCNNLPCDTHPSRKFLALCPNPRSWHERKAASICLPHLPLSILITHITGALSSSLYSQWCGTSSSCHQFSSKWKLSITNPFSSFILSSSCHPFLRHRDRIDHCQVCWQKIKLSLLNCCSSEIRTIIR
jgi:hypothetical protein